MRKIIINLWQSDKRSRVLIFLIGALVVYLFIISFFGLLYYWTSGICYSGSEHIIVTNYSDCFYFSYISFLTIGYGDIFPVTASAKTILFIQSIFSITFNSIFAGFLVYLFIKRPKNIFITDYCFVRCVKDKFFFSVRVGNKGDTLIDCKANIELLQISDSEIRTTLFSHKREFALFERTWLIDINLSKNEQLLRKLQSGTKLDEPIIIRITFTGTDTTNGEPIGFVKYYLQKDIIFGQNYEHVHTWDKNTNKRKKEVWKNFNIVYEMTEEQKKKFYEL